MALKMVITNAAVFMAKVYHESYVEYDSEIIGLPVADWNSLSSDSKQAIAGGFQRLIDLKVIEPFSLDDVKRLRLAGFKSVLSSTDIKRKGD